MLHRKIEKHINEWIADDKRALLVYGVRQAGKTYIIRECLKKAGCKYAEFNLIEEPEIAKIIKNSSNTDDLIIKLSLYRKDELIPGETVIFFDEIQKCREILTKIKFLVEDQRFKYVMSGSLLGVELVNLLSAPVGYLKTLKLYPLDYEEFLQVFGVPEEVIGGIRDSYLKKIPVDETIHSRLEDLFRLYIIIGGMPAAVEKYRQTNNIDRVIDEHLAIVELYKMDFTQYEEENRKLVITNIYELMPAELNEQNKRFKIADINKNLRYERISDSFVWLWKAGVALPAFNLEQPLLPLMINQKSTLFKLFFSDIGMLTSIYGKNTKLKILNGEKDVTKGAVYENVIAQELMAHGYKLYYLKNKKIGELDFVIEDKEEVLPIEVKSKIHSALSNVLTDDNLGINEGLVFAETNVQKIDKVTYLPLYMVMAIENAAAEFEDISLEKYIWK